VIPAFAGTCFTIAESSTHLIRCENKREFITLPLDTVVKPRYDNMSVVVNQEDDLAGLLPNLPTVAQHLIS
jgi:hypothetical protein